MVVEETTTSTTTTYTTITTTETTTTTERKTTRGTTSRYQVSSEEIAAKEISSEDSSVCDGSEVEGSSELEPVVNRCAEYFMLHNKAQSGFLCNRLSLFFFCRRTTGGDTTIGEDRSRGQGVGFFSPTGPLVNGIVTFVFALLGVACYFQALRLWRRRKAERPSSAPVEDGEDGAVGGWRARVTGLVSGLAARLPSQLPSPPAWVSLAISRLRSAVGAVDESPPTRSEREAEAGEPEERHELTGLPLGFGGEEVQVASSSASEEGGGDYMEICENRTTICFTCF